MRNIFFVFFSVCLLHAASGQDTLLLINGKMIPISSYELNGNSILYKKKSSDEKLRRMNPDRVFSILNRNGTERIIFRQDTLDPYDFTKDEMRLFIRGEQDAARYYKNNVAKATALVFGTAGGLLGFYGILVPPLYSTVLGSFSPNMKKQTVSDPALLNMNPYLEGYERKVRDRKIRNSMISGMIGLVGGIFLFNIIYNN